MSDEEEKKTNYNFFLSQLARELATQIQKVVVALGDFMNAQSHACIGGTNVREDMRNLEQGGIKMNCYET